LNGFVGEFLILSSTFMGVSQRSAVLATLGVILSAAYMLSMVQRIFYGPERKTAEAGAADLRLGEQLVLWPLAVLMLVMGVSPNFWFRAIEMAPKPIMLQQSRSIEMLNQPAVIPGTTSGEVQR
jgi:NADH-quinone oxidoreductase subunit M